MDNNSNTKTDDKQKDDGKDKKNKEWDKHVEELEKKVEELENKYKRVLADYQNLEKRVAEERKEWVLKANKDLLLRLLPVLDTLMLATLHSKDQSLIISSQQFQDILKQQGVEKIKTTGEIFDPNSMECIDTVEGEEGKIIEETRAGYRLYNQVLRPAQVKVGSAKQNQEEGN